jgi:uncharacterized protein YjbJ (UPF0337 family)
MGFLDKVLGRAKATAQEVAEQAADLATQAKETAGDLAEKHGDKITGAVDKATGFVDEKTGGKLHGVTEKVSETADKAVDALRGTPEAAVPDAPEAAGEATGEAAETPPAPPA